MVSNETCEKHLKREHSIKAIRYKWGNCGKTKASWSFRSVRIHHRFCDGTGAIDQPDTETMAEHGQIFTDWCRRMSNSLYDLTPSAVETQQEIGSPIYDMSQRQS
jgi:hypothetical protein